MNRVLKRPMFRIGGSAGTGITSGLDKPRAQYANGTTLERLKKATGAVPNNRNLSQFLTTFGLDLLSRPPSGGFFSTVAQAAQQPTQTLQGTDISRLGSLGALNQAQRQAELDAQREATRQATFLPQEQLDRFAGQVTGIMGGYPGSTQTTNIPNPTPLQTALGVGTTLAGIYGTVKNAGVNPFFKT